LDISANSLGQLVAEGWTYDPSRSYTEKWQHSDGRKQHEAPTEAKPAGAIALADAIKSSKAMTSLNVSSNDLLVEGAKHIAAALPGCK
jgi:hypothetical protein